MRFIAAFLAAPMLPALLPAWSASQNGSYQPLAVFVAVCGAFYALQIVVGVPAWLLLRRFKQQHIWFYAVIGFVSVALPFVVYAEIRSPSRDVGQAPYLAIYLGLLGGLSAAIFWLIVRPNRVG